jgi:hypothetical protein
MGLAPAAHVLFNKFMTFNPKNPEWVNRDRFALSYVFTLISSAESSRRAMGRRQHLLGMISERAQFS